MNRKDANSDPSRSTGSRNKNFCVKSRNHGAPGEVIEAQTPSARRIRSARAHNKESVRRVKSPKVKRKD